ncbi:hypothetical protein MMC28_010297 [Mycoblastus sanguinarius]|nr:hypothetical protein [Mycoblastus sanguinarius]
MSGSKLDQIVKGAPRPGTSVPGVVSRSPSPSLQQGKANTEHSASSTPLLPSDLLATLPSSPPQIYLNLLILEASLRSQYLTLRARRRQNTFFLFLLTIWIAWFSYLLFLRPREDGSGVGGSVYWVVEMGEKVALMGGVVTGMLIWGTGQWDRGVRWPRRWVGVANRGLRSVNAKIVVIKGPWWKELLGHLSFLFPYSSFFPAQGSSYHYIDPVVEKQGSSGLGSALEEDCDMPREEDLSPGGDYIKLLLLPKPFSPDFRENWELYRLEYWERENERRTHLRQLIVKRERELARQQGGWLWWLRSRGRKRVQGNDGKADIEKSHHRHHLEREGKRRHSFARTDSHSRNTSRSSTPSNLDAEERPTSARTRRGSNTIGASERRRKAKSSTSSENIHMSKINPISRPA